VPVHLPGWQDTYDADQWVEASGALTANPAGSATDPLVLVPDELDRIEEPSDPYVF
jgi:putative membrane protein